MKSLDLLDVAFGRIALSRSAGVRGTGKPSGSLTALDGETMLRFEDVGMGVQTMVNRPDLVDGITKLVMNSYDESRASEFSRCIEDKPPLDVVVCMGSGRCMYPSRGGQKRLCAFCTVLPGGNGKQGLATEAVRRMVMGN